MSNKHLVLTCSAALSIALGAASNPALAQDTIESVCLNPLTNPPSPLPGYENVRVVWERIPYGGSEAYRVKSLVDRQGVSGTAGWTLFQRPLQDYADGAHFDPNVTYTGAAITSTWIWAPLIPKVPLFNGDVPRLATLLCPDGRCFIGPGYCTPTVGDGTQPVVTLVGDSLVDNNELCVDDDPTANNPCPTKISERFIAAGTRPTFNYNGGQSYFSWLDMIRQHALLAPRVQVLAFGTNDAGRQANAPSAQRSLRRQETQSSIRAAFAAARSNPNTCVVAVTVAHHGTSTFATEAAQVNAMVTAAASDPVYGGKIKIANWHAEAGNHCGVTWQSDASAQCDWFTSDQVHLSKAGANAHGALLTQVMQECLQQP